MVLSVGQAQKLNIRLLLGQAPTIMYGRIRGAKRNGCSWAETGPTANGKNGSQADISSSNL